MKTSEKIILVTGANGGLAKETIKHLIKDGYRNFYLGSRTVEKSEQVKSEIEAEIDNQANLLPFGGFDMNAPESLEKAVSKLPKDKTIDIVFLGAGGVVFEKDFQQTSWKGMTIEKTSFQNVIGGHIVVDLLRKQDRLSNTARIVYAGGEGARGIPGMIQSPDFKSAQHLQDYLLKSETNTEKYNPMNAIGVSKLLGALWVSKMAQETQDALEVLWFSPGLTYGTKGLRNLPPAKRWFMEKVGFGLMQLIGKAQSPTQGARKFADAISGKIGRNGDVIGAPKGQTLGKLVNQKPMNPNFTDQKLIDSFWNILVA